MMNSTGHTLKVWITSSSLSVTPASSGNIHSGTTAGVAQWWSVGLEI